MFESLERTDQRADVGGWHAGAHASADGQDQRATVRLTEDFERGLLHLVTRRPGIHGLATMSASGIPAPGWRFATALNCCHWSGCIRFV